MGLSIETRPDFIGKKEILRLKHQEDLLIRSLLQSIHDEIETLWETYQEGMGVYVESLQENRPLLRIYPVIQDYFTVYHGNAFLIGKIKDNDLRKHIIVTYTQAKSLIDSYRTNNEMVQKYDQLFFLHRQTNNPTILEHLNAQYSVLVEYAKGIKAQHNRVKDSITVLLRMLRKKGVLSENEPN